MPAPPSAPDPQPPTFLGLWKQFLPLSVSDVTMAASEPLVAGYAVELGVLALALRLEDGAAVPT